MEQTPFQWLGEAFSSLKRWLKPGWCGESEGEEEPAELRDRLVFKDGGTRVDYHIGVVPCDVADTSCAIILIAELGGRLIVAVPGEAWHRVTARRKPPGGTSSRSHFEGWGRGAEHGHGSTGRLRGELQERHAHLRGGAAVRRGFGKGRGRRICVSTAESGGGGDGIFKRMSAVEAGLTELKGLIRELGKEKVKEPAIQAA